MSALKVSPFLMFEGSAEEAIKFYVGLFQGAKVLEIVRYGAKESGVEGSVKKARFSIGGQTILCIDSSVHHEFALTPAFSLFVECESEALAHQPGTHDNPCIRPRRSFTSAT